MDTLLHRFKETFTHIQVVKPGDRIVLASSGGLDSSVLTDLCIRAGFEVILAHVNYGLRGSESDDDETFVRSLAKANGLEVVVLNAGDNKLVHGEKGNLQKEARDLRYDWFEELRSSRHAAAIFTAHHQDDQVETIIHQFFRGAFIHGLAGIRLEYEYLVRPLLHFSRVEIKQYAEVNGIIWRQDSSNVDVKYTRNLIRHELIPLAERVHAGFKSALLSRTALFTEAENYLNTAIDRDLVLIVENKNGLITLSLDKLISHAAPHLLLHSLCQPLGFTNGEIAEVAALISASTGSRVESGEYTVWRESDKVVIEKRKSDRAEHDVFIHQLPFEYAGEVRIKISWSSREDVSFDETNTTMFLAGDDLEFPLKLRPVRPGDRFIPLGMKSEKKISDFVIHEKLPRRLKDRIRVLCDESKILAIPGMRPDERCRIDDTSVRILKVECWQGS